MVLNNAHCSHCSLRLVLFLKFAGGSAGQNRGVSRLSRDRNKLVQCNVVKLDLESC